jgi:homoserine dehydrogenase
MKTQKNIRLALLGFGPVNRSFAEILADKGEDLCQRYGIRLSITAAVDSTGGALDTTGLDPGRLVKAKGFGSVADYPEKGRIGMEGLEAIAQSEADIILEATTVSMQDGEPGMSYVRTALSSGKHVVMANKGPLVQAYQDLHALASDHQVLIKFSATLGGSLPTYNMGVRDLAGCTIERVDAILNGTSHYILSSMNTGVTYDEALAEAQRLEIAERDPTLDVEGWDAANKLVILANSVLNMPATLDDIERTGISHLKSRDLPLTMLGTAIRNEDGTYSLAVRPERLPVDHPLAALPPLSMGLVFHTDLVGPLTMTVNERGPKPTAAAMLRDVLEIGMEKNNAG